MTRLTTRLWLRRFRPARSFLFHSCVYDWPGGRYKTVCASVCGTVSGLGHFNVDCLVDVCVSYVSAVVPSGNV